jgi:hypothetical protein
MILKFFDLQKIIDRFFEDGWLVLLPLDDL